MASVQGVFRRVLLSGLAKIAGSDRGLSLDSRPLGNSEDNRSALVEAGTVNAGHCYVVALTTPNGLAYGCSHLCDSSPCHIRLAWPEPSTNALVG